MVFFVLSSSIRTIELLLSRIHPNILALTMKLVPLVICLLFLLCRGDDNNHIYGPGDSVTLWVNSVGPYHNPQETYPYYQLPYCKPAHGIDVTRRVAGIGEVLEGNALHNSGLKLHFATDINREDVCDVVLDATSAAAFELAVDRQYWYVADA